MFCSKCGTENKENAKFCGKCGAPLREHFYEERTSVNESGNINDNSSEKQKSRKGIVVWVFAALLLCVGIIVLNIGNGRELVGRWQNLDDDSGLVYLEFLSDGTLIFEGEDSINWDDHVVEEGTYWTEDGNLYIIEPGDDDAMEATYEITDGEYLDIYFGSSTLSLRRCD